MIINAVVPLEKYGIIIKYHITMWIQATTNIGRVVFECRLVSGQFRAISKERQLQRPYGGSWSAHFIRFVTRAFLSARSATKPATVFSIPEISTEWHRPPFSWDMRHCLFHFLIKLHVLLPIASDEGLFFSGAISLRLPKGLDLYLLIRSGCDWFWLLE